MAEGDGAGGVVPDEEAAGEAGAAGAGNGVDVIEGAVRGGEGFLDDGDDLEQVLAAGDLGDNAAVFGVQIDLGRDDGRQGHAAVFDDGGSGLVAGGFDGEDFHIRKSIAAVRRLTGALTGRGRLPKVQGS